MNRKKGLPLIDFVSGNRALFFAFILECNKHYRFSHDLKLYQHIIQEHRAKKDLSILLQDDDFLLTIHNTLKAWNMDQRGARLTDFETFRDSVLQHAEHLVKLYEYKLHSTSSIGEIEYNLRPFLKKVFLNLQVMASKRKIVGVSKTLHFLLPDLVIPIDSKYTMYAFYGYNKYSDDPEKEFLIFEDILLKTFRVTQHLQLTAEDVDGAYWNTSIPKLIDNSIIGCDKFVEKVDKDALETEFIKLIKEARLYLKCIPIKVLIS
jgi:hypothetical protein